VLGPERVAPSGRQPPELGPEHAHRSGPHREHTRENPQQGRLPAAAGSEDEDALAPLDPQRGQVENGGAASILELQVADLDGRCPAVATSGTE
jgi:hypothetical protein